MTFVVFKSYDGGKRWEGGLEFSDFASAASAARTLNAQDSSIRYRVEAVPPRRPVRKVLRSKPAP